MLESLSFGSFRRESQQLCCNEQALALRPKAWAVRHDLANHPERLVPQTELVTGFIGQLPAPPLVLIAHGQCVEQYGGGEAYLQC
jgi:hypothetical protein